MPTPRRQRDPSTAQRILAAISESGWMFSSDIRQQFGVSDIGYYLRHHVEAKRVVRRRRTNDAGITSNTWEIAADAKPVAPREKKHKCRMCLTTPVTGFTEWVCANCKNKEAWRDASPYAIA